MCGRFVRFTSLRLLGGLFDCPAPPEMPARYNIAPTQPVPVVRVLRAGPGGASRELARVRWGLISSWADDPSVGNRMINARSETAAEKRPRAEDGHPRRGPARALRGPAHTCHRHRRPGCGPPGARAPDGARTPNASHRMGIIDTVRSLLSSLLHPTGNAELVQGLPLCLEGLIWLCHRAACEIVVPILRINAG